MIDLSKIENRKRIINEINSNANKERKQWALRQFEVQNSRIKQYVKEDLLKQFSQESVRETPIVSSINIQKKVTKKKSTVYSFDVKRDFSELDEDDKAIVDKIYADMKANRKFGQMCKSYIYQEQSIGMIVPKNGKLIARIFKMHQIDAIPSIDDPEEADVFIISAYDREENIESDSFINEGATGYNPKSEKYTSSSMTGTANNTSIATDNDYKRNLGLFIVWSKQYNFFMNGKGEVLDPETMLPSNEVIIDSPLAELGIMPFFEVAQEKDYEFFVRPSNSLTEFTIQFNSRLSDESNIIKMNGYSVAIIKAPSDMQPTEQIIGPTMILKLKTDDPSKEVDFSFASPQSNIAEISGANDKLLNYFITTEDIDGDEINSSGASRKYASGLDRFIAITDSMHANKDTYESFRCMESDVWEIIKAWQYVLKDSNKLDRKYKIKNIANKMQSEISVKFGMPELIQSESEKLAVIEKKIDKGLMSRVEAIMLDRGVSRERAIEIYQQIIDDEALIIPSEG